MDKLKEQIAVEDTKIGVIETQLADINNKLDNLIETVTNNHLQHIDRYNRLSERITVLEASRDQLRNILAMVTVGMVLLEFLLKYVIK